MQKIPLYRYTRPDGGVTVSTVRPEGEYTPMTRLVADEGYTLTDGTTTTSCTDTATPEAWKEIPDPEGQTPEEKYDALVAALSEVYEDDG